MFGSVMSELRMVLCTFPDIDTARQIGTSLVEKQLAACVNLVPGVESIYRWQGKTESAPEVLAVFKTTGAAYPAFATALAEAHPYEVPEIISLEPGAVDGSYLDWCLRSVSAEG